MPPITTVPPFSTSTSVLTCLVSIAGPDTVSSPRESLFTSRLSITRPSGVICGLTRSARLALRNDTLVAPELVACWYGISTPCSITASIWSAVITFGRDTILPRPSASSAEISRSRKRVALEFHSTSDSRPGWAPLSGTAARLTARVS